MMRQRYAVLTFATVLSLAVPGRAHAWWEFLEGLSGPGPFYGFSIDARLLCIVDKADGSRAARLPSGLGVITTSCNIDTAAKERRRAAIDLGAKFLWANDDDRYANGNRISLTTLAPSLSLRLIKSDRWDFVDYGVGAGAFWFASEEFRSFNGTFIEPFRLEFHATSNLRQNNWAALIPRVRTGLLVFPGGFENAAFAAAPGLPTRISRDRVWNIGIFFDMEPLMKYVE